MMGWELEPEWLDLNRTVSGNFQTAYVSSDDLQVTTQIKKIILLR
jgi:hypothetical protein